MNLTDPQANRLSPVTAIACGLSGRMCACACEHLCRISVTDMPPDCDPSYVWLMDQRCKGIFHSPMYQEKPSAPGFDCFAPDALRISAS